MNRSTIFAVFVVFQLYLLTVSIEGRPSQSTLKNHELLTKIGFAKIKAPNNHHRKRLAVESRHRSRSDDSHMFIIKLPPNPHFYIHSKPNEVHPQPSKNIPVGFKSNGKPGKIYHWNIPVLKKIAAAKQKSRRHDDSDAIFNINHPESWNEVLEKTEKDRKPLKPSYYVPIKPKKASFTKYFPGNGKPHSFYVIEKSKKAHYHRLLP